MPTNRILNASLSISLIRNLTFDVTGSRAKRGHQKARFLAVLVTELLRVILAAGMDESNVGVRVIFCAQMVVMVPTVLTAVGQHQIRQELFELRERLRGVESMTNTIYTQPHTQPMQK